ncbi:hypothetical protein [Prosthecomicrobium hirschii]|uniref:hypothetical protein n=1 Tax=Prosthecodimorpha hirschii TaxID=665126 RepID=UPI00221F76DF|nr:hypothetical protein [Prosthecomicrobium hirschii]MCW1844145.1 hypothetical protein [Prosthecomicrobium hirschii]
MQHIPISDLPTVALPIEITFADRTSGDPVLRRVMREARGRVMRRARRERIAAKRAWLEG